MTAIHLTPSQASWQTLDSRGVSALLQVRVPADSRSVTLLVQGQADTVYALSRLQVDQQTLVDVPAAQAPARLRQAYTTAQQGRVGSGSLQFARLGSFTLTYPWNDLQAVPKMLYFRVAADRPGPAVKVSVILAPALLDPVLHLRVFQASDAATPPDLAPALLQLERLLAQAGVRLKLDGVWSLPGSGSATVLALDEPWASPRGLLAQWVAAGRAAHPGAGLALVVVDHLPRGTQGQSLGLPGPPDPADAYFGVVVVHDEPALLGRHMAHEIAHYLGLPHPGGAMGDISDVPADADNLMNHGESLSRGQVRVLRASALLVDR